MAGMHRSARIMMNRLYLVLVAISEPEIDKWIKAWWGDRTETDDKKDDAEDTHQDNFPVFLLFREEAFLPSFYRFKSSPEREEYSENQHGVKLIVEEDMLTVHAERKHLLQVYDGFWQGFWSEEYPADQYDDIGNDDAGDFPDGLIEFQEEHFVGDKK